MDHARYVIRDAIRTVLASAGTVAGARVYDHPFDDRTVFPSLVIEDAGEAQDPVNLPAGPQRTIERTFSLMVTAEVQQISAYARTRDRLLAEAEAALASAALVGVKAITPAGYQPGFSTAGERPIALGHQRFDILYYTSQGAPNTTL